MTQTKQSRLISLLCLLMVTACASQEGGGPRAGSGQGGYKVGQPYQISGTWYYPREDYSYDETGVASWYGSDFHGQTTANGEVFNKDELTAAHRTLPLPTLARVTNLDNGKSIVVRINDRGPFSSGRIIDMSQRAARLLGFEQQGTAKVRVQVLADESKAIADAMRHYGSTAPVAVASAEPTASAAPLTAVTSQTLTPPPGTQVKNLEPVETTPAIHQQLLETKPVATVVQLPVTGATHLYVQAGSFTVLENATKLQQNLSAFGHASISNVMVNGKQFYRVRIGPVADVSHADSLLTQVKHAGISNARTIVD